MWANVHDCFTVEREMVDRSNAGRYGKFSSEIIWFSVDGNAGTCVSIKYIRQRSTRRGNSDQRSRDDTKMSDTRTMEYSAVWFRPKEVVGFEITSMKKEKKMK